MISEELFITTRMKMALIAETEAKENVYQIISLKRVPQCTTKYAKY